jgi:hypothetical protein
MPSDYKWKAPEGAAPRRDLEAELDALKARVDALEAAPVRKNGKASSEPAPVTPV